MANKGIAMIRYQKRKADILPDLPKNRPIFWINCDCPNDDILPSGAVYKLSCTRLVFDRAEIITRWPTHQHHFVTLRNIQQFKLRGTHLMPAA